MTRVAVYCRISSDDVGEALGVARQEADCRARIDREDGWILVEVYVDNNISASEKSTKTRPGWEALLAAAERMEFEVILGYSNSRFSRDVAEKEALIDLNRRTGVRVCTIMDGDENYETSDGRMVSRIRGAVDAAYSERISENVKRAALGRVDLGRPHGGQRPFGWGADTGRTQVRGGVERPIYDTKLPREPEFSALREAILGVTGGASVRSVAQCWDAAGLVSTGKGTPWTPRLTSVLEVLTRWRNCGVRVHLGQPVFDAPLVCEPVVTREQLEELHDQLADRRSRRRGSRVAQSALMGGLSECGVCGAAIRAATHELSRANRNRRVSTYRCAGRGCVTIRRELLDVPVIDAVIIELMSSDLTVLADSAEDRAQLRWLRTKLADLEAEGDQLGVDRGEGVLTRSQFIAANSALQRRVAATEAAWRSIRDRFALADWVKRKRDLLDLSDEDRDTATVVELARFEALPLHRRREIIRRLLDVTVHPRQCDDRVQITARASRTAVESDWSDRITFILGAPPRSAEADES